MDVTAVAHRLTALATEVREVGGAIRASAAAPGWVSLAAARYRERLAEAAAEIDRNVQAVDGAIAAMRRHADQAGDPTGSG